MEGDFFYQHHRRLSKMGSFILEAPMVIYMPLR